MTLGLREAFNEFFELIHADTEELRHQVYQLRYQVYVLETGFEPSDRCICQDFPGNGRIWMEKDEFDARSDHYLVRHRRTGVYAATTRLILPDRRSPQAIYPIESHCKLEQPVTDTALRMRLGEISRFAVSKVFKRRIGEAGTLAGVAEDVEIYFEEDERRVLNHISLGLMAAILGMAHEHGISHCYAVMEPALLRLLSRFGVLYDRIGPDVNYHGLRVPCLIPLAEAAENIHLVAPPVWELITNAGEWQGRSSARAG
ncbi:MAG: PEP-CTERM/exosortase system-associated acyltransferase [Thiobacillaceae bacterium]|nr:PEP-CTERM/exosortase system-associated acyltransferase [Thiobacillaceae bacterium]